MRAIFIFTIFLSSTLLFLVQPMLAKAFLPKVGGAPATWIVCMMFFQLVLLAGYAYASVGSSRLGVRTQMRTHLGLLILAAALTFPITLPVAGESAISTPTWFLLTGLLAAIALPYFALSANSSLLQRWYFERFQASPYHLFAASNAGSLLGLIAYPIAVEWWLPLSQQLSLWAIGFGVLLAFMGWLTLTQPKSQHAFTAQHNQAIGLSKVLKIVWLAFVPSSLFLSTTLMVTTDIASTPLLWVIPLALYLITMIIAFSRAGPWCERNNVLLLALSLAVSGTIIATKSLIVIIFMLLYFMLALHAHLRLAKEKPEPQQLAAYYLWLSVGGALGGVFNTLAPLMFEGVYEYWTVLLLYLFLPPRHMLQTARKMMFLLATYASILGLLLAYVAWKESTPSEQKMVFQTRNFFGVSKVMQTPLSMNYAHGNTLHGKQALDPELRLKPTTYYVPLIRLLEKVDSAFYEKPFGVLGMGVGTLACMGKKDQTVDFYEIDQAVIDIAQNSEYFTYLRDCPPAKNIFLGDGRLELKRADLGRYNLLVMDAFTSDAVPMHLLTLEALKMYQEKMDPLRGILAYNVSNRYIDFVPMLSALGAKQDLQVVYKRFDPKPQDKLSTPSIWLLMYPKHSPYHLGIVSQGFQVYTGPLPDKIWTDDYSNFLPYMKW